MRNKIENNRGFTFVEVLVIISIISLISSIIITATLPARAKASDVKTISQVRQVQNEFQIYTNDGNPYPVPQSKNYYYCIGQTDCSFWGFSSLVFNNLLKSRDSALDAFMNFAFPGGKLVTQRNITSNLASVLPSRSPSTTVIIDNAVYNDYVYKCRDITGGVCTGAVYWAQSQYTLCPSGSIEVYSGVGGRVCGQNAGGLGTDNVEVSY